MKRRYHLLQGGPRRRDTQTFVPILWQGQGFKRNNFYLAIRNILIKGTLWFGTGFRDRDKVISTANSQNLELPEYQTSTQLFFSRVCTQNLCFLLILQSAEWHKVKCKSRLNPNQHWKCARTPSAALACAWPMVFIPFHCVFHCIYTQQVGELKVQPDRRMLRNIPWISRQISSADRDSSMPQQTPLEAQHLLCLSALGRTHISSNRTGGERTEAERSGAFRGKRKIHKMDWEKEHQDLGKKKKGNKVKQLKESWRNVGEKCQKIRFVI